MATALLILFGGRSMPNILTIIHEKPEVIAVIVSQDFTQKLADMRSAIADLFEGTDYKPGIDDSYIVDAFDRENTRKKSLEAVETHPDYNWMFNVTAATTIMSIGAYEAAKELAA